MYRVAQRWFSSTARLRKYSMVRSIRSVSKKGSPPMNSIISPLASVSLTSSEFRASSAKSRSTHFFAVSRSIRLPLLCPS